MTPEEWYAFVIEGYNLCEAGDLEGGLAAYTQAEAEMPPGMQFSPTLNLMRHTDQCIGEPEGLVMALEPTEDVVVKGENIPIEEAPSAFGMQRTKIDAEQLHINIRKFHFNGSHHLKNLKTLLPHTLVMSTGRCGTMSLYRLLQRTQYIPQHQFLINSSLTHRLEQMCRYIAGEYGDCAVADFWMKTRAAEWLGPMLQGRPMAAIGHHDTIWAPVFSCLHPRGKIIYLRRNPRDVFKSMYSKGQWGEYQLRPIFFRFDGEVFSWKDQNLDIIEQIVWYMKFTEVFSRALGRIIGRRWIEIDADKLFAQNEVEIKRLRDFLELDLPFHEVKGHFDTVHNRKAHKITPSTAHLHSGGNMNVEEGMKVFEELWDD
jgi:hypothetical protein